MLRTKKLEYLRPDIESGYFKGYYGRENEHYRYLQVPCLKAGALAWDIDAGASRYRELRELAGKGWQRYLVIDCETFEEGLMAVGYLEELDQNGFRDGEETPAGGGAVGDEDFPEWDLWDDPAEPASDPEDAFEPWYYDERNIPIIDAAEVFEDRDGFGGMPFLQFQMQAGYQADRKPPYWLEEDLRSICVLYVESHMGSWESVFCSEDNWKKLELLKGYRHVYIIRRKVFFNELGCDEPAQEAPDATLCRLLFEFEADRVSLPSTKENTKLYRRLVFDRLLEEYHMKAPRNFPRDRVIAMLEKINPEYPNCSMEKALRYIARKYSPQNVKEEHFKNLGVLVEKRPGVETAAELRESDLVGMEEVKHRMEEIVRTMKYQQYRSDLGMKTTGYRNVFLMLGAPGTAKTTVARILGKRFAQEHLLKGNRFGSFNGAELKGMFVGHTAPKIHEIFEENDIIFIDEAYSLAANERGHMDLFSQEALAQLAIELENHGTDRLILFAGYGGKSVTNANNKMKEFLDANPGIKSRINGTIYFSSYNAEEMVQIVHGIASHMDFVFEENVDGLIGEYFAERVKDKNFGNGREARSFVENCQAQLADRVMQLPEGKRTKSSMVTITREDVENTLRKFREENEAQLGRGAAGRYGLL